MYKTFLIKYAEIAIKGKTDTFLKTRSLRISNISFAMWMEALR